MSEEYTLEKEVWTDSDFDKMGWHDCLIRAISIDTNYKVLLDIDYIFKWIEPAEGSQNYKFLVSPCTLIFDNVHELRVEIDISEPFELLIDDIERENSERIKTTDSGNATIKYRWIIRTQQGDISFKSTGYRQYVRLKPVLLDIQWIELKSRGGINFDIIYSD